MLNRQLLELLHPALQPCWGTHTPEQLVNLLYSLSVLYDTDRLASLGRPVGRGLGPGRAGGGSGGGGPGSSRHLLLLFDAEQHVRALLLATSPKDSGSSSSSGSGGGGDGAHGNAEAVAVCGSGSGDSSSSIGSPLAVGVSSEKGSTTAAAGVDAEQGADPRAPSSSGGPNNPVTQPTTQAGSSPAGLRAALAALHLPTSAHLPGTAGTAAAGASSPANAPTAGMPRYGRARLARAYLTFYTCAMSGVQHFSVAHSLLETLALCLAGLDPADPRVIAADDLGLLVHGLAGVASYQGHVLALDLMRWEDWRDIFNPEGGAGLAFA